METTGQARERGTGIGEELRAALIDRYLEGEMPDRMSARHRLAGLLTDQIRTGRWRLSQAEQNRLIEQILDDVLGLGPLEPLLGDADVTEIMVNGPYEIYVEKGGVIEETQARFADEAHLMRVIDRIVGAVGRRVDESSPFVDARLLDGSRVNVIIPPLALKGPTLTIRRFPKRKLQAEDLLRVGALSPAMLEFLSAAVQARLNILVTGGTSTGKTTLLNILSSFIPQTDRIITVEDAAELQLQQRHVVPLESRPPSLEGKGIVGIRDLVRNALRMRPDRLVVGEVRGPEAMDMIQAMNTGHDGSMSTLHANSPSDGLDRLETLAMFSSRELPPDAIRRQIGSALNLIVHVERVPGGMRKVSSVTEVVRGARGLEVEEIFKFVQTSLDEKGAAVGYFTATGRRPAYLTRLAAFGRELAPSMFAKEPVSGPQSAGGSGRPDQG
jgi:pilus assembly protein CpaF